MRGNPCALGLSPKHNMQCFKPHDLPLCYFYCPKCLTPLFTQQKEVHFSRKSFRVSCKVNPCCHPPSGLVVSSVERDCSVPGESMLQVGDAGDWWELSWCHQTTELPPQIPWAHFNSGEFRTFPPISSFCWYLGSQDLSFSFSVLKFGSFKERRLWSQQI